VTRLSRRALLALPVVLPAAAVAATVTPARVPTTRWVAPLTSLGRYEWDDAGPTEHVVQDVLAEHIARIATHSATWSIRIADKLNQPGVNAMCMREGLVRLGEPPKRAVTADVYGIEWGESDDR